MKIICSLLFIFLVHQSNYTYKPWEEEIPQGYEGTYLYADFSHYTTEKYLLMEISISFIDSDLQVGFKKFFNTDLQANIHPKAINNIAITGNDLTSPDWKLIFDTDSVGTFFIKYPPVNAKGKVEKGLLFGDRFFVKVDDED